MLVLRVKVAYLAQLSNSKVTGYHTSSQQNLDTLDSPNFRDFLEFLSRFVLPSLADTDSLALSLFMSVSTLLFYVDAISFIWSSCQ